MAGLDGCERRRERRATKFHPNSLTGEVGIMEEGWGGGALTGDGLGEVGVRGGRVIEARL